MERLTEERQIGPFASLKDKSEAVPGAFATYDCLYAHMVAVTRLKQYEDAMPLERAQELARAEKDERLVVLPCKDDIVYTIEENYFNCTECKHGGSAHYQAKIDRVSCDMDNGVHCPLYIKEHKVDGFEVGFDASGAVVLSAPGEFGYEGLERFSGIDGKVYYTRAEAWSELERKIGGNNGTTD